jgi:hypothetical protein
MGSPETRVRTRPRANVLRVRAVRSTLAPDRTTMTAQQMLLHVGATDAELAYELSADLMQSIDESPADDVERRRGESQEGQKGAALDWASLAVTFTGGLPAIIGYVRGWLHRQPDAQSITIELDGDKLVLERATPEMQAEIVQAFLARHAPAEES